MTAFWLSDLFGKWLIFYAGWSARRAERQKVPNILYQDALFLGCARDRRSWGWMIDQGEVIHFCTNWVDWTACSGNPSGGGPINYVVTRWPCPQHAGSLSFIPRKSPAFITTFNAVQPIAAVPARFTNITHIVRSWFVCIVSGSISIGSNSWMSWSGPPYYFSFFWILCNIEFGDLTSPLSLANGRRTYLRLDPVWTFINFFINLFITISFTCCSRHWFNNRATATPDTPCDAPYLSGPTCCVCRSSLHPVGDSILDFDPARGTISPFR
jgi:hypothetical protein